MGSLDAYPATIVPGEAYEPNSSQPSRGFPMNLFLGVTAYEVRYSVGQQRLLFELDAFLLRGIADHRLDTVESIEEAFQLPRTMIMEVLLRLFNDGWIAVPSRSYDDRDLSQHFVVTRRSEDWLASGFEDLPPPSRFEIFRRTVIREQFLGGLAARRLVGALRTADDLQREEEAGNGLFLPARCSGRKLDESSVKQHVSVPAGCFYHGVYSIQPRYQPLYLSLAFDSETARIAGLPRIWESRLMEPIRAFLVNRGLWTAASPGPIAASADYQSWESISHRDFRWFESPEELFAHIEDRLRAASPTSRFALVLEEISVQVLERLRQGIEAAVAGGAAVDLLWGRAAEGVPEWLTRFWEDDRGVTGVNWNRYQAAVQGDCFIEVSHDRSLAQGDAWVLLGTRRCLSDGLAGLDTILAGEIHSLSVAQDACRYLSGFLESLPGETTEKPPASAWRYLAAELSLIASERELQNDGQPMGRIALLRNLADCTGGLQTFLCAREDGRTWFLKTLPPGQAHALETALKLTGGEQPPVRIVTRETDPTPSDCLRIETRSSLVPDGVAIAGNLVLVMGLHTLSEPQDDNPPFYLALALERFPNPERIFRERD